MASAIDRYWQPAAAAYVRGILKETGNMGNPLVKVPLDALDRSSMEHLAGVGLNVGARMGEFLKKPLPARILSVLELMETLNPENVFDVGTGRGLFLYPFLERFPDTFITCNDLLSYRTQFLDYLVNGGLARMNVINGDFCELSVPDHSYDVVTMLQVLEHFPDVERAVRQAVWIASKYVIVTVPLKAEDNPPPKHHLDRSTLQGMFQRAGCKQVDFYRVQMQIFMLVHL